jgi:hypothetical protein
MSDAVQSSPPRPPSSWSGRSVRPANIVGVGAVTGYGWGTKHLWDGFLLGESAVKLVTGLDGYVPGGQAYLSMISDEGDPRGYCRRARARMEARPGGRTGPRHRDG